VFIELVESLRCPRPHEETWLVAAAQRTEGRDIVTGILGCPICGSEYPVVDGVADFAEHRRDPTPSRPDSPAEAMRLAATLDLTDPRGFVLLTGEWGAYAHDLASIVENQILLVNPPDVVASGGGVSILRADDRLPIARGSARAAAIAAGHADMAAQIVEAVRSGGRVIGGSSTALPEGTRELARDEEIWVAEREPLATAPVPLTPRLRR
jgi:uncharacterized protein YbaR (Trm112 family)